MKSTNKHKKKTKNDSFTRKIYKHQKKGGDANAPVSLVYNGQSVPCDACKQNSYIENYGALGKAKGRAALTSLFFGDLGQSIDTTSIIAYFCNNCGLAKIVRDLDYRKVRPGQAVGAPPAAAAPPVQVPPPVKVQAPAPNQI